MTLQCKLPFATSSRCLHSSFRVASSFQSQLKSMILGAESWRRKWSSSPFKLRLSEVVAEMSALHFWFSLGPPLLLALLSLAASSLSATWCIGSRSKVFATGRIELQFRQHINLSCVTGFSFLLVASMKSLFLAGIGASLRCWPNPSFNGTPDGAR